MWYYIILLIIIALVIILSSSKTIEGYDYWHLSNFNQNWNKPWKNVEVSANNPWSQDIPSSSANDRNFPQYILEIFKEQHLFDVLNTMKSKSYPRYNFKYIDITPLELYRINKDTWYKRYYEYQVYNKDDYERNLINFMTIKSCLQWVNKILDKFLTDFNIIFRKYKHELEVKKFHYNTHFSIWKYKIHHIKQAKKVKYPIRDRILSPCALNFGLIIVLIREDSLVGPAIYIEVIIDGDKMYYKDFDLIGYYNTDELFLLPGLERSKLLGGLKQTQYYNMHPLFRKEAGKLKGTESPDILKNEKQVTFQNAVPTYNARGQYQLDNVLKDQYACFNAEAPLFDRTRGTAQNIILYTYNRYNCESGTDQVGKKTCKGVWDRPCLRDEECLFTDANKNYPNQYGRCNKLHDNKGKDFGYCQLPLGMQQLGYHYHVPYDKYPKYQPLCYNCKSVNKSDKAKPMTKLDTCCEEQKDRNKYPHLKSPDYAFLNDITSRINYFK